MGELLSVSEAQRLILSDFLPTEPQWVTLDQAYRRVLAEDVRSLLDLPSFANSSMDGFAIQASDVAVATQDNPVCLDVVGDAPAGQLLPIVIASGQAVRIMTGAALPTGCDSVVPIELTRSDLDKSSQELPKKVEILTSVHPGDFVRPVGQDVRKGDLVLTRGTPLYSQHLAMLAMLGYSRVPVYRRPRIAVFSSGDELVPVGGSLQPGKIFDLNTTMLVSLVEKYSCEVINLGIVPDRVDEVRKVFYRAADEGVDLILSSAGVSVGSFDYVRTVLESDGEITIWRVNMRPGKPLTYGRYQNIPFIGLPGNPVSAFVGFEVFVRPVLDDTPGQPYLAESNDPGKD